jgi:hypothetical protein
MVLTSRGVELGGEEGGATYGVDPCQLGRPQVGGGAE